MLEYLRGIEDSSDGKCDPYQTWIGWISPTYSTYYHCIGDREGGRVGERSRGGMCCGFVMGNHESGEVKLSVAVASKGHGSDAQAI